MLLHVFCPKRAECSTVANDSVASCFSIDWGLLSRSDREGHLLTVRHPLSLEGFLCGMADCPDEDLVHFVLDGIWNGVHLGPLEGMVDTDPWRCKNEHTVKGRKMELRVMMREEVAKGRKLGPFVSPPFNQFKCSPVSFVPKWDSDKVRLIHNLSHPFGGNSVNALITSEEAKVQYQRFKDFLEMVQAAGPGAELGKIDLTDTYKHVLVHPDFWHLLGIHIGEGADREFYIETVLPFRHRLAPKIFTAFSDALVWVAQRSGAEHLFKYVDEFASAQPAGQICANEIWMLSMPPAD